MLNVRLSVSMADSGPVSWRVGVLAFHGVAVYREGARVKTVSVQNRRGIPDTQNMQTKLNEYGGSGWELVAVSMGSMTEPRLIFKK